MESILWFCNELFFLEMIVFDFARNAEEAEELGLVLLLPIENPRVEVTEEIVNRNVAVELNFIADLMKSN